MEYRIVPRTGDRVSVIGMGSAVIGQTPEAEIIATVRKAVEAGINFFDLAAGHAEVFPAYGKALRDLRRQVLLQVHFGANYVTGEYGWSTELDCVKASIAWQLENLCTDYVDYGFIHCMDELSDYEEYCRNGVLDYLLSLKAQGVVRHIGMSSHTPIAAQKILDTGLVDLMMFSINPAYDYEQGDEYGVGTCAERMALYRRCERDGVGISVMKPFCGGQLLSAEKSPFHRALTPVQCLQYALDQPAVVTVLAGIADRAQLREALSFFEAPAEARDYSAIYSYAPDDAMGNCVYCRHCHPCPVGLDIGLINKYYDLSLLGDVLAGEHYATLAHKASDCISCGHCDRRCPFHVAQSERMKEIKAYFGC